MRELEIRDTFKNGFTVQVRYIRTQYRDDGYPFSEHRVSTANSIHQAEAQIALRGGGVCRAAVHHSVGRVRVPSRWVRLFVGWVVDSSDCMMNEVAELMDRYELLVVDGLIYLICS